jgi:flagellar basal-body rod modification protein FlgD
MPISEVSSYTGYDPDYVPTEAGSTLGKDDFLKLIVTQLSYQDPLEPMQSSEFMTQMAAMGQLEQMTNLNSNFEQMMTTQGLVYGSQLIGQTVTAINQTTKEVIEGTVGDVSIVDGEVKVSVGGTLVSLSDVTSISPWASLNSILGASQLIGMKITAIDPNDTLGLSTISGVVEEASMYGSEIGIKFKDSTTGYTYRVALGDILSVSKPEEESSG